MLNSIRHASLCDKSEHIMPEKARGDPAVQSWATQRHCWWRDDEWGEGVDGQRTALLQLRLSRLRASGPNSSTELILQKALRHILAIIYKSSQLAALTAALSVFMCRSDHISRSYVDKGWSQTASRADPYPVPPHHGEPRLNLDTLVSLDTDSSGEEGIEETIVYLWTLRNFCGLQEAVAFHNILYCSYITAESPYLVFASPRILCTNGCFLVSVFWCLISLYSHTVQNGLSIQWRTLKMLLKHQSKDCLFQLIRSLINLTGSNFQAHFKSTYFNNGSMLRFYVCIFKKGNSNPLWFSCS